MTQRPTTEAIDDLCENIDKMIPLLHKKIELMGQLKRSMRLCQIMDVAPKQAKGRFSTHIIPSGNTIYPHRGAMLQVRYQVGAEEPITKTLDIKDVHPDLWPADLLASKERWTRHMARAAGTRGR